MKVLLLILVVIGALFVIASGVWVAIALANVISARRAMPESTSSVSKTATPAND